MSRLTWTEELDEQVCENLDRVIESQGITNVELARATSLSKERIRTYRKGLSRVSAGTALLLTKAMGVPVGKLYEGIVLDERVTKARKGK